MRKICSKCSNELAVSEFYKDKRGRLGVRSSCKSCVRSARSEHYRTNRDKCIEAMRSYEERNSERLRRKRSDRYYANVDKKKTYEKKYYADNKQYILDRQRAYFNRRYHTDIQFKLKTLLRKRLYAALDGLYKNGSAVRDLGCSIEELKHHLESQFVEGMSWDNYGSEWHIDHVQPLSSFNLSDYGQLKKACHYTNLQPLWAEDNLSKSNKNP